ncbi:hypothetical protein [Priestia megaterium]|uniref:hypothetical protein n=1 Tax=Priestia megaterium TaxID=1404 RepID=UPI0006ABC162|nr:hypothetical protein AMS61_26270 [Bacillus sp. FJAT-21351]KQU25075.1 hypothetical protein ASG61_18970 [Bacillus sp. Leaf75]
MKEKKLQELTKRLNDLFNDLINGNIKEDEFNDLSDKLYRKQTRLRYEIEHEKGSYYRNFFRA